MPAKRNPRWRQETPRAQLVVTIQAAQGHLMNAQDGINVAANISKALSFLEEAQEINKDFLLDTPWTES